MKDFLYGVPSDPLDDIFTTASTTNEISKLLRLIPVNKITILTLLTRARDTYISDKEND